MHGVWGEDLASWGEVASLLGLPIEVAQAIVRAEYKGTADRLDKLEEFALSVEAEGRNTETVMVCFGSPTNREIGEGYWENPKSSKASDGRTVTVKPGEDGNWNNPVVIEPEGARIVSARHTPGMHGGYWTIEVVVPA